MPRPKDAPRFPGFVTPFYTQIPNVVFDELLADLSGAEWKVLSYIMRHTFGWHKDTDNIALKQLTDGIRGVDKGTGLAKSTVAVALNSLEDWGLIERTQNRHAEKGDLPTTYRVRLSDTGRDQNRTPETSAIGHGGVLQSDTQKIDPQKKNQKNGATDGNAEDAEGVRRRLTTLYRLLPEAEWERATATLHRGDPDPATLHARVEAAIAAAKARR